MVVGENWFEFGFFVGELLKGSRGVVKLEDRREGILFYLIYIYFGVESGVGLRVMLLVLGNIIRICYEIR